MILRGPFDGDDLATMLDALNDRAENFYNAAEATDGDAKNYFVLLADSHTLTYDKVYANLDLTSEEVIMISEALKASADNCTELGDLDTEAAEYADLSARVLAFV